MTFNFCLIWQFLLVLLFIYRSSHAQEETFIFSGRLLDATTLQPITEAHLLGPQQQTTSDSKGYFQVRIKPHTKLTISHVGYESKVFDVGTSSGSIQHITLFPVTVELDAVTVGPLPDEAEFKQLILQAEVPVSQEEANLKQNMAYIRSIQHLGYFNDMNSYDMFLGRIKDGGTVSFLSNNPSLGILAMIRRLRQDKTVPGRTPQSQHTPSLYKAYRRKEGQYHWLFE